MASIIYRLCQWSIFVILVSLSFWIIWYLILFMLGYFDVPKIWGGLVGPKYFKRQNLLSHGYNGSVTTQCYRLCSYFCMSSITVSSLFASIMKWHLSSRWLGRLIFVIDSTVSENKCPKWIKWSKFSDLLINFE